MSFSELGLGPKILHALKENKYVEASPIQKQAIPHIHKGHDVIACAQTGTGKTAAFCLPLIEKISSDAKRSTLPQVLILSPTRELAQQIANNIEKYSKYLPVKSAIIYGGVSMAQQVRDVRRGVNMLVATPGRLLDHLRQGTINLSQVNSLVLDEADRMLDMGFIKDVKRIIQSLSGAKRQNLLFSATFSPEIKALAHELLSNPKIIQIAKENTAVEVINQIVHPVDKKRRRDLLSHLIREENWRQVLVFTRTKHGANRLAEQLNTDGHDSVAIHGNKSQNARAKALDAFKKGQVRVLVATDVAARGIDIQDLPNVVNYDLPQVAEDYVHRIGRTGRAGKTGKATSLVCIDDITMLRSIEHMLRKNITRELIPGYEPDPSIKAEPAKPRRGMPSSSRNSNSRPNSARQKQSYGRGRR